jgi:hypothetical protein
MDQKNIGARETVDDWDRMSGESYPLELARRAIAAQAAAEPEPLDDPWFVDEEPRVAAEEEPSYQAWVDHIESCAPPPPSRPAQLASQLAALLFL